MNGNKGIDSKDCGEYEDDFEKDLEWLINEKEKNSVHIIEVAYGKEEIINQELKENEEEIDCTKQLSDPDKSLKDEVSSRRNDFISVPSVQPLEPMSDSDSEYSFQESKVESPKDLEEEEDEEVRRYIMEKIIQANKLLQNQEPVDDKRERKLKFKDKLVDLEVPPLEDTDDYKNCFDNESNVSGKLSQLCISNEITQENVLLSFNDTSCEESKDRKILVERDGKFELLNLQDIESQGFLPPINNNTENELPPLPPSSPNSFVNGVMKEESVAKTHAVAPSSTGEQLAFVPQPPANPKTRPHSAVNSDRSKGTKKSIYRTHSTNISPVTSTYCLSPRQKELQKQLEQRRERLKKEQAKRGDPHQAFRLWLKKKHEEQMKERKTEELRRQEECLFFLKGTEGRERAFKQWLRRKHIEKLAEQQAVKERSRQLRLEAKRSRQLQSHLYTVSEAKSFRFTDHYN
ncbi:PREDICTED: coiled-coil domain-containing protein 181 [Chrysochloris asiatica]|uniref:Coiled-coil domain-containing protein 181 n=1 Tax=Chrysochloris asiatica TaxID=185453 RepID=A0A9B0WZF3_CHRAS|nr:PREDICTED: coiled-coil domain-containing protein 181 [Chrysochloris asiatica]